jgi:hypothetical protein
MVLNIEKLVQVCNYLLKKYDYRLNYTKLIKELYLADKEALKTTNKTITGDVYVNMKNGVVLSKTYDLIKDKYKDNAMQILWNSRFTVDDDEHELVALSERIPESELSQFEKDILDEIDHKFHDYSYGDMIKYIHTNCPEWKDPGVTSYPLHFSDVLRSLDVPEDEIDWIVKENEAYDEEEKLFASFGEISG